MRPGHQSPVDIPAGAPRHHTGIEWSYRPTPLVLGDNHAAVQVDCARGSSLVIEGQRFELEQFHFHCPGEHTFEGARSPMELHLVHRSHANDLVVIGVMFVEGAQNAAFEPIVTALAGRPAGGLVDPIELLPADRTYVAYDGSLTMPPYSERVAWRVLTRSVDLSPDQLHAIETIHLGNNRPVQPLHGRRFE